MYAACHQTPGGRDLCTPKRRRRMSDFDLLVLFASCAILQVKPWDPIIMPSKSMPPKCALVPFTRSNAGEPKLGSQPDAAMMIGAEKARSTLLALRHYTPVGMICKVLAMETPNAASGSFRLEENTDFVDLNPDGLNQHDGLCSFLYLCLPAVNLFSCCMYHSPVGCRHVSLFCCCMYFISRHVFFMSRDCHFPDTHASTTADTSIFDSMMQHG